MGKDKKIRLLSNPAGSWLLEAVKGKKRYVALQTLLQVLVSLGYICYSLLFRAMIDRAVEKNTPGFFRSVMLLVLVSLTQILIRSCIRRLDEYCCAKLENVLKKRLFSALLDRDFLGVSSVHTAHWMNRLTSDTIVVARSLAQIIPNLVGMGVKMIGAFLTIFFLEPRFALLVMPAGAAIVTVGYFIRPLMKRLHKEVQESDGDVRVLLQERLDNLLIVSAYDQQPRSVEMAEEKMQAHLGARMKRNRVSNLNQVGFGIAMQGMYVTAAAYGAWGILNGTISYGTMTSMLQMVSQLQSPLSGLGGYFTQWYALISSAERLMEAEMLPGDYMPSCDGKSVETCGFESILLDDMVFSYVERDGEAELSVTIHYDNECFRRGEFIALAGRSGCGKSTLLKLLLAVYKPDSGRILVTEREGTRPLTGADRRLFAYVPQGNMLMSGTLRQIIAFYDKEAMKRDDELWLALRVACADEFVRDLPSGLDTVLGEHGTGLSEGQIQRIAIARAIFSNRPVLLLDEATSALDEQTEASVLDNLKTMTDRTVLIVTHRPRACEICDRVINLEPSLEKEGGNTCDGKV